MQLKLIVITYCQFTIHNNDNIIIMEDSKNNQKKKYIQAFCNFILKNQQCCIK